MTSSVEILHTLITKTAEAKLAAEWAVIAADLTAVAKRAGLNQLVSTEDVGFDQTFFHGLEVRDTNRQVQPMTRGFLRLNVAALVGYAQRSHRAARLPVLMQEATQSVEAKLAQMAELQGAS